MYTITHEGENVGHSELERGDPTIHAVSGLFSNMGGAIALAAWIKSIGGKEEDRVVFIELDKNFNLHDEKGKIIEFQGGNLISRPDEDEVFLDITGISDEDYKTYFEGHIKAMDND